MVNPTQRFSNRVENYVKYRPGYPTEAIDDLVKLAHITSQAVIADIGSGTGIFTQLLLDKGYTVYAVEPNDAMRASAVKQLSGYSNFHSVNGTAETSTLSNSSVDLIVCAQAFHWFDQHKTKAQFKRILKPKGLVVLIWNNRQIDVDEFAIAYELLLQQHGSDYKEVNHRNITDVDYSNFFKDGHNYQYLIKALMWCHRAITLQPQFNYYDTIAHIMYRLNFNDEAQLNQQKAIDMATTQFASKDELGKLKGESEKIKEHKL